MTVAELIKALEAMPQDAVVVHWIGDFLEPVLEALPPGDDNPNGRVILT